MGRVVRVRDERRFGDLRSLLHARPDAQRWDELCALVDQWPDHVDLIERVLPYACAQLITWPESLRTITADARAACITDIPPPCTALCRELDLSYHYFLPTQRITNSSFARMLQTDWFGASATHLSLSNHPVGDQAIEALVDSPLLSTLTHLTLDYTCITHEGLGRLARAPHNHLESLSISNLDLDDRALDALREGGIFAHLQHLDIARNAIGDGAVMALAQGSDKLALRHVDLSFNAMTDEGAFALAAAANLPDLERLAIDYNDVGLSGWRALMHAPHLWHAEVSCYPVR